MEPARAPILSTLAELLAPIPITAFLEALRDRTRLHVKATDPTRTGSLLAWDDIERLIATPAFLAEAELMKDGMPVPAQLYAGPNASEETVDVSAFHDILGQGASIVVRDIARWVPGIARLAVAVERSLGINTIVNAYLSFAKGGAFRPHWDRHDVLIVQVHGRKLWRFWDAPLRDPVQRSRASKYAPTTPPVLEVELLPGEVFFIPRGDPHAATVSGESSVHLTIGLNTLNGLDFLQHLRAVAESDEFLRADLPRTTAIQTASDAAFSLHEEELKRRLHQLIDRVSLADFLQFDDLQRAPSPRTWLAGESAAPEDVVRLTLRRRVPLAAGEAVVVGGKPVTLTLTSVAVLEWLFEHDGASRASLLNALAPQHAQSDIERAIGQLRHDGLLTVERGV